jgi:hypothetical protein
MITVVIVVQAVAIIYLLIEVYFLKQRVGFQNDRLNTQRERMNMHNTRLGELEVRSLGIQELSNTVPLGFRSLSPAAGKGAAARGAWLFSTTRPAL